MAQGTGSRSGNTGKGSSSRSGSGKGSGKSSSNSGRSGNGGSGRGSSGKGYSGSSSKRSQQGSKKQYTATTRDVEAARRENATKRRRDLKGAAVNLPNWVIEGVERVTPADRVAPTLEELGAASEALADGKYQSAVRHGQRAKALSSQDPTIRETIGLAAYRMGDWGMAISELRAYRRMAGETTHLPIEMDALRAQGRDREVENAWAELQKRGGHGLVMNEGSIVYASYLLDAGRVDEAWKIIDPGRTVASPNDGHLRRYYVAARVAAAKGETVRAKEYADVIIVNDPAFPGYDSLTAEIAKASKG